MLEDEEVIPPIVLGDEQDSGEDVSDNYDEESNP